MISQFKITSPITQKDFEDYFYFRWFNLRKDFNQEFGSEKDGYTATRHQREVGTGYFDMVSEAAAGGESSTTALSDSTEADQF